MQKVIRYLFSLLVLLAYMFTSIGFGVHECSAKGTRQILIINIDRPCEQIHDYCSCNSKSCSANQHSHNCCSTEIYHLDLAYDNTDSCIDALLYLEQEATDCPMVALNSSTSMSAPLSTNLEFKHGPPIYIEINKVLAILAQWRL